MNHREETHEIEAEATDRIEDDAAETCPPNAI
jgi:ferredoxin